MFCGRKKIKMDQSREINLLVPKFIGKVNIVIATPKHRSRANLERKLNMVYTPDKQISNVLLSSKNSWGSFLFMVTSVLPKVFKPPSFIQNEKYFLFYCLLFTLFSLQMISDAGYQSEVGAMYSACNQIDVFSKVMKTSVTNYFSRPQVERTLILNDFVVRS